MLKLAIVGTGGMAHSHARQFAALDGVKLMACCDVNVGKAQDFATEFHIPFVYADLTQLLHTCEVDAITNVTPDRYHAPLSMEALAAGKHVFCEKPLATDYADARKMARLAAESGRINLVNFSYRNSAALQQVAARVRKGDLGRIFHVQAHYLQSWLTSKEWGDWKTGPQWLWRLSQKHGSKGVLGDVGVHLLDFASFPVGDIVSVNCHLKTFKKAPRDRIREYPLDANDSAIITVDFEGGATGALQTTRLATGHVNSLALSIHGEYGAFRLDLDRSYYDYEACFIQKKDGKTGPWKTLTAPAVPTLYQRFVSSIQRGKNDQPDFARGAQIQRLLDACERSQEAGRTVSLR